MGGFSKDNSYGDLIYTNEDTNIEKERQYFWEAFPAMSLVRGGDHVVAASCLYAGMTELFERILPPLGVETTFVAPEDTSGFERAVRDDTGTHLPALTNQMSAEEGRGWGGGQEVDLGGVARTERADGWARA